MGELRIGFASMRVLIVGDSNSGKTTFLGLLYATQVRSGSDKADSYRFHAPPESLEEISLVFQQLMSGAFPDAVTKQAVGGISFQVGYRRSGFLHGREWAPGPSPTLRFSLLRNAVEAISRLRMRSAVADAGLKDLDDSDAVAILVDSTKLVAAGETPGRPLSDYDGAIESLLNEIQRSQESGGRRLLHSIFVFSKFDRVRPEVLRAANVAAAPPPVGKIGPRAAYAEALLNRNLPRTLAKLGARERGDLRFAKSVCFFSWVRVEETANGQPGRIRLRRSEMAGWEPDYSSLEYLALLQYLGSIAVRSGD